MKCLQRFFVFLLLTGSTSFLFAQNDTASVEKKSENKALLNASADTLRSKAKRRLPQKKLISNSLNRLNPSKDSTRQTKLVAVSAKDDSGTYQQYMKHPYLPMNKKPVMMLIDFKQRTSKDFFFYLMSGIVLLLAFIKTVFPKYFKNIFLLFFQTSLRQKQTRDQIVQDALASLLMNFLFMVSTGLFITLICLKKGWIQMPFWNLYAYSAILLFIIYTGKRFVISFAGWVFSCKEVAQNYIFLVAMVNRIIGVILIPVSVFITLGKEDLVQSIIVISFVSLILLFIYRYLVSFRLVRFDLKINPFHFLLYLCSVEILPMLLIYKLLVEYIG